jgi:hypothetical protein
VRVRLCSICLAAIYANSVAPECGHAFHEHCLADWHQREQDSCPNCRRPLGDLFWDDLLTKQLLALDKELTDEPNEHEVQTFPARGE